MKVLLAANPERPATAMILDEVRSILSQHAEIVAELAADSAVLSSNLAFERMVAVGGDGTLIAQVRRILERGVPMIGVNSGRLGFLAEFDLASFEAHAQMIFGPTPLVRQRLVMDVMVKRKDSTVVFHGIAINDAVVTAGPPFRMIELQLRFSNEQGFSNAPRVSGEHGFSNELGPDVSGDGVIIASPLGSTAYSVSAGGPIVHPDVEALIVTPICPHSLGFRPIVVPSHLDISVRVVRANEGTTLVLDGQTNVRLSAGDTVQVGRHQSMARLVGNPDVNYWQQLLSKMRWAAPPTYRDRGV
ncbi:MAG: NAD(+)/NADH kinase [Phycisphaerales bacterium]|nr:NAD(+)/NADH kinase [Phycisphaerales bacterium]